MKTFEISNRKNSNRLIGLVINFDPSENIQLVD